MPFRYRKRILAAFFLLPVLILLEVWILTIIPLSSSENSPDGAVAALTDSSVPAASAITGPASLTSAFGAASASGPVPLATTFGAASAPELVPVTTAFGAISAQTVTPVKAALNIASKSSVTSSHAIDLSQPGIPSLTPAPIQTPVSSRTPAPTRTQAASRSENKAEAAGNAPLYYNTYEYQLTNNTYFPENKMKPTIDWLADNFRDYGFDYFTLDGWINKATRHTTNGYITTHSDAWKHDLSYWADYAHSRDLKFGFYYPPFWIHKKIVNDTGATVEGTKIKVADVVSKNKMFEDWYLVDPDRKGAREYMEGFVRYMKKSGIDYMKVDFLMHYEDSMGAKKLEKTLSILSGAAEREGILLSLSAPNNHKHAAIESLTGDMLRISQDVYSGGWNPFSSNGRGKKNTAGWPEWNNAFDAFIDYSDLTGKGKIVLDGDFVIAHSFRTDAEAKAAVSLPVLAGAGLGMSDIPEKLGQRAWVYQNREILDLNQQGLIGKPLSRKLDSAADPNALSQIWTGRLNNGDWVVGFFNREEKSRNRSINFNSLGISGKAKVRDLWLHKDLGSMSSYSADIESHGVTVIRISKE